MIGNVFFTIVIIIVGLLVSYIIVQLVSKFINENPKGFNAYKKKVQDDVSKGINSIAEKAEFQGVVTALTYHGDGSNLTGIAATDYVHAQTLQVNGISTFSGSVVDTHGQVGVAKSVLTSTGAEIGRAHV